MARAPISNRELDITESDLAMDPDQLLGGAEPDTTAEIEDAARLEEERRERESRTMPDLPDRAFDRITPQV